MAAERNEARLAEYKAWVKSYTPDQIRLANNARAQLRRRLAGTLKGAISHTQTIEDGRQVKRPTSAWGFFFAERQASSDFGGITVTERSRLISSEWKELSASEKQVCIPSHGHGKHDLTYMTAIRRSVFGRQAEVRS